MRAVEGMIAILVGVILVFSVTIPILNNGILGSAYSHEAVTNTSVYTTYVNFTTDCAPLRTDTTYVKFWNSTGSDESANIAVVDATKGVIKYTDTITATAAITGTLDYRCLDGAYISNDTARGVTNILPTLVVVLIIVALAAMVYVKRD
jgi:hypothetical protein